MPVKKISEAPDNIKELDEVALTLSQINSILRVYDALKAKGKVDSPMAVAIAQFKKANHTSDGQWVKNEEKKAGTGMSMVDLNDLERYVVIQTGAQSPGEIDDLRELEGDWGHGVYPLWSDGLQSIVAFAFEPTMFNADEAQAWVKEAMEKPPAAMRLIGDVAKAAQSVAVALVQTFSTMLPQGWLPTTPAKALRSFDDIRQLVSHALDDQYGTVDPLSGLKAGPWILDMGPRVAIVEHEGKQYAVDYQIDENDTVTLGVMTPVDKEWTRSADGAPVMLHAFAARLKAGDDADEEEDDSLIWKEIIRPGKWFKADSGRLVEVTAEIIQQVFEAWEAGLPKLISVPSDSHHARDEGIVPVESNRGFVDKLKMIGDRLFGAFKFTDPNVAYGVQVGNIADVSVYLQPNVVHHDSGDTFPWILQHVLLTNNPLVTDLDPFNAIPASGTGTGVYVVQSYQQSEDEEVVPMEKDKKNKDKQDPPESVVLTAGEGVTLQLSPNADAEAADYKEFQALGLSASDVKVMVAERQQVRKKARGLEITHMIRALEGIEAHDAVVQVESTRHYPVVCVAVEKALREHPEALALTADDKGQTSLDAVVMEIVNAIPQEGRMALSADGQPSGNLDPKEGDLTLQGDGAEPTDAQIDELGTRIS